MNKVGAVQIKNVSPPVIVVRQIVMILMKRFEKIIRLIGFLNFSCAEPAILSAQNRGIA